MILGNMEDEISLPFPGAEGFDAEGGDGAGTTGTLDRTDSDTAGTGAASASSGHRTRQSTALREQAPAHDPTPIPGPH